MNLFEILQAVTATKPNKFKLENITEQVSIGDGKFRWEDISKKIVVSKTWEAVALKQVLLPDSFPMFANQKIKSLRVHKKIYDVFANTIKILDSLNLLEVLNTYDGAYYPRRVLHSTNINSRLSVHSYGIAIDLDARTNAYNLSHELMQIHPDVVFIFEAMGWTWLGRNAVSDGMHFDWVDYGRLEHQYSFDSSVTTTKYQAISQINRSQIKEHIIEIARLHNAKLYNEYQEKMRSIIMEPETPRPETPRPELPVIIGEKNNPNNNMYTIKLYVNGKVKYVAFDMIKLENESISYPEGYIDINTNMDVISETIHVDIRTDRRK
jgi:hypothetical protein